MAKLAKNPLKKHFKGLPCVFGEAVGRIVGESEKGSWGIINGIEVFSVPLFSTPHGSITYAGRFYLEEIDEDNMKKLLEFEEDARANEELESIYAGRLTEEEIEKGNEEVRSSS